MMKKDDFPHFCSTPPHARRRSGRAIIDLCGVVLCLALLFGHVNFAMADDGLSATQAPSPIQFTVIASKRVKEGNHSVIYNRVVPPQLPVVAPGGPTNTATATLAQGDQAVVQPQQAPLIADLLVSATVFNHQISEINWTVNGVTYHGYSNIDFSLLDCLTQFTSADTIYSLMLVVTVPGANSQTGVTPAAPVIPQLAALTSTQSDYVVVAENGQTPPDDAFAPMDALHDYYDAHRTDIAALHTQYQANLAAQAQWRKDHPVVPQNTVINFWPIKSHANGN